MKPDHTAAKVFAISVVLAFAGLLLPATATAADAIAKPVKIYVLSGQSNMTGRGELGSLNQPAAEQKATLVRYIMEPENVEKYKFLYDGPTRNNAGWTIRDDVFITTGDRHGGLTTNYGLHSFWSPFRNDISEGSIAEKNTLIKQFTTFP